VWAHQRRAEGKDITVDRVLIVEDEPDVGQALTSSLTEHGFSVERVATCAGALERMAGVDLFLLDLGVADCHSLSLCSRLSERAGLVVISSHDEEADRVAALELGADDYLAKPFGLRELVARCRSVLRRTRRHPGAVVRTGDLEIDLERYEARHGGRPVPLTTKELGLLVALARRPGCLVRREDLAEEVWGAGLWPVNRSIDVHMSSLRRKLGDSPRQPRHVQTVHGLGFRLLT
jgi:DNA-binding response OmpR family regulator